MMFKNLLFLSALTLCSSTAFGQNGKSVAHVFQNRLNDKGQMERIAVPVEQTAVSPAMVVNQVAEQDDTPMTLDNVNGEVISRPMTPAEVQQYKLRVSRRTADNNIFVSYTIEGVAMTFEVLSEDEKTCQVGVGEGNSAGYDDAAIDHDYDGVITIPEEAKGYKVVQIGNGAFFSCSKVKAVHIPNTVKTICYSSFRNCRALHQFIVPASVEDIHTWVTCGSTDLELIEVSTNNPVYNSQYNCNGIVKTETLELIMGCKATTLADYGIKSIGSGAFTDCSTLTSMYIPETVSWIGGQAFQGCTSLATITVNFWNPTIDSRDNCNCIIRTSTNELWVGAIQSVIPESVTSIRSYAFSGRYGIETINLPKDITSIGYVAFSGCPDVKKVIARMPQAFDVDQYTFNGIYDKATLYVPKGTKTDYQSKTGWGSFKEIVELDENDNPVEDETEFTAKTIEGVEMQFKVLDATAKTCQAGLIINSSTSSSSDACVNTSTTGTITIPSEVNGYKVVRIAQSAFYGVTKATAIIIPNTVESIGKFAFAYCPSMQEFYLPASVTQLDNYALADATGRTVMRVDPANPVFDSRNNCNGIIETATNNLVAGCVTTVIPNTVKSITNAFFSNNDVKTIHIPASVENINGQAFSYCYYLERLNVESGNPVFDSRNNCGAVIETATNKLVRFAGKSFIPATVTAIGGSAIEGNNLLEKLEIPSSVTSIGSYAFYNCYKLYQVTSRIEKPFEVAKTTFNVSYEKYPEFLYVPAGTKDTYMATSYWNMFTNIEELGSETTITIDPLPDNNSNFSEDLTGDEDLSNTNVDNILFTLNSSNGDGYDSTEGCVVVNTTMTEAEIDAIDMSTVGTPEFAEQFTGMVIAIKAGRGSISIDMQSLGSHALGVKIGGGASVKLLHQNRNTIVINYNVAEDTYVLLYAIESDNTGAPLRSASIDENSLKIYSVSWERSGDYNPTGISTVNTTNNAATTMYTTDGRRLAQPIKGVNIINGHKVVIK